MIAAWMPLSARKESEMPRSVYSPPRKLRWPIILLIAGLHVLALFGLGRLLAPDLTDSVIAQAGRVISVTVST